MVWYVGGRNWLKRERWRFWRWLGVGEDGLIIFLLINFIFSVIFWVYMCVLFKKDINFLVVNIYNELFDVCVYL